MYFLWKYCQHTCQCNRYSQKYEIFAVDSRPNDYRFFFLADTLAHRNYANVTGLEIETRSFTDRTPWIVSIMMHEPLCKTRQSATRTLPVVDIKVLVGSIFQFSAYFQIWIQDLSETYKMSDRNVTRLPFSNKYTSIPYIGDDINHTLTRGERWAQHPSNDVQIVLMCCILGFVEYPLVH